LKELKMDLTQSRIIIPVSGQFELTETCNNNCLHCYNYFRDSPTKNNYDLGRIAVRIAENKIFHIDITGGEPFLLKDKLLEVASVFNEHNMDFSINTNLAMASEEDPAALKEKGLISILTSLLSHDSEVHDYLTQRHGSFKDTLKGISKVKKLGINIGVNMVINDRNKRQVYDTGKFVFENLGIDHFYATPIVPPLRNTLVNLEISAGDYIGGLDALLTLQDEFGLSVESLCPPMPCIFDDPAKYLTFFHRSCVGGRNTFSVSSDGEVRPCSHSDEKYGNILSDDLESILSKMTKWRDSSLIPEDCKECSEAVYCRGGCRIAALATSKNLKGNHPYFEKPLKTKIQRYKEQPLLNLDGMRARSRKGTIRYREEFNGMTTVYLNPISFATLDPFDFKLFRFIISYPDKRLGDVKKDLGLESDELSPFIGFLKDRSLITLSS